MPVEAQGNVNLHDAPQSAKLHSMTESATEGVRDRRKLQTRTDLIRNARRLTAEHGLAGFTLEELCDRVGVSRRTFFNYFASKEDAVIGRPQEGLAERALVEFAVSPPAGESLLDELTTLFIGIFETSGLDKDEAQEFAAALEREPRLFTSLMRSIADEERRLTEVIASREGLDLDDPAAIMAALLMGTILRRSAFQFFETENDLPFADLMTINLHAVRRVLLPTEKEPSHDHHG